MILGDGEEKNELNKLIKNLNLQDRVHLIGRVENVYEYMKQADVFVLSSLWEELGFVIVEAAFNNLFVISVTAQMVQKNLLIKINVVFCFKAIALTL